MKAYSPRLTVASSASLKAVEPKWDLKTDWQIISEIATRMGYPMHYNNTQEIWDELRHLCPDFYGATYEKMGELGYIQWPCRDTSEADQGTSYLFKEKFDTPNGLAQFFTCDWVAPIDNSPQSTQWYCLRCVKSATTLAVR